jgi:inner membrane protein
MTAKGHMVLSIPIAATALYYGEQFELIDTLSRHEQLIYYMLVLFGSVLPDIDEPGSYIGRKIPIFSNVLAIFIKHRGITHFFIIPLLLLTVSYFEKDPIVKLVFFSLGVGVFAHTAGDMLTKGGIRGYFFPFFRGKTIALMPRFLRFYTNSLTEYLLIAALIAGILIGFVQYPHFFLK